MTSSAISETLKSITTIKLNELSKKRKTFDIHKLSLLINTQREPDQLKKLRILVDSIKKSFVIENLPRKRGRDNVCPVQNVSGNSIDPCLEVLLKNIERFLEQAQYDPTISPKLLLDWEASLMKKVNIQSLKLEYATLYGELVNEWLNSEQSTKDDLSVDLDGFELIDKAEKQESRRAWENLVFESLETDQAAIATYLGRLFGKTGTNKQALKALGALRRSVKSFEVELADPTQFDEHVLQWTINGLLASRLLSDEKNAVLKDFLASPIILTEVADVLNMRITSIETWSWGQEYLPVEQRRHLNGKYHVYIDEDLLEAIFLQYIGVRWSIFFKEAFRNFSRYDGAWNSLCKPISQAEITRREYFLGPQQKKNLSVQSRREGLYNSIFFMSQLPHCPYEASGAVEGEEEVNYDSRQQTVAFSAQVQLQDAQVQAQMGPHSGQSQGAHQAIQPLQLQAMQLQAAQQQAMQQMAVQPQCVRLSRPMATNARLQASTYSCKAGDVENGPLKPKSPMETKQFLLHLLSSEVLINTRLHGDFTCTRSEFDSWSPSLPHSTIRSVLSFFGLSRKWLGFFNTFLEAPLKFVDDGPIAETRTRKRGVPGAHSLSAMYGEVVLFVLDYAVNQHTDGAVLYRMHDDFWIWSSSHEIVVKGWEAITTFSTTMGVTLNKGKTGTVRIQSDPAAPNEIHPNLPTGEIRWGFLVLDPGSGRFIIDQEMVDKHIDELRRQLQGKKSVFSWIQAWNAFTGTFFKSNFGKPANCFGRAHVDMMLDTMTRIQKGIFQESNVVEYLKQTIEARFGVTDIPDGYLYFPTNRGGLELQNPFIGTLQVRKAVCEKPSSMLDQFFEDELEAYRRAQKAYENGKVQKCKGPSSVFKPDDASFMPFEEFSRYREEVNVSWTGNLLSVFDNLLKMPGLGSVDVSGSEICHLASSDEYGGSGDGYWEWVGMLYGREILERFEGLNIVDRGLLPVGMVHLFRSGRIKWQG